MRKGIILWGLRVVGSVRFGVHTWTLWVCRSGRGTLFRQTCFAIALDECVLHRYVTELEGFADDPAKSNESRLEAIQMAWHEEFEDAKG